LLVSVECAVVGFRRRGLARRPPTSARPFAPSRGVRDTYDPTDFRRLYPLLRWSCWGTRGSLGVSTRAESQTERDKDSR
jgi:hypothetical protein